MSQNSNVRNEKLSKQFVQTDQTYLILLHINPHIWHKRNSFGHLSFFMRMYIWNLKTLMPDFWQWLPLLDFLHLSFLAGKDLFSFSLYAFCTGVYCLSSLLYYSELENTIFLFKLAILLPVFWMCFMLKDRFVLYIKLV